MEGDYAYGYLKAEKGVHRLVRLSPYDADHARHTSFALAEVLPQVEEGVDIEIDPADLRIETFKAGGAGGQSVQKNSTAVRITHVPTGIKASCQNERSLYQNRTIAMGILAARLMERETEERAREMAKIRGEHVSAEWGNQIRSYVLHPYKMVKDHRTSYETSDTDRSPRRRSRRIHRRLLGDDPWRKVESIAYFEAGSESLRARPTQYSSTQYELLSTKMNSQPFSPPLRYKVCPNTKTPTTRCVR